MALADVVDSLPKLPAHGQIPQKSASDIFSELPKFKEPPTFLQWYGVRFVSALLGIICLLVVIFLLAWWLTLPSVAEVKALLGDKADGKDSLEALQGLRTEHSKSFKDLFQLFVLTGLVPLFTLLAGYVFGTGPTGKQGE